MPTLRRIMELATTKYKLQQLLADPNIRTNHADLAVSCLNTMLGLETEIMTLENERQGNNQVNEDKYEQARN